VRVFTVYLGGAGEDDKRHMLGMLVLCAVISQEEDYHIDGSGGKLGTINLYLGYEAEINVIKYKTMNLNIQIE
jgi:hypothetical protein